MNMGVTRDAIIFLDGNRVAREILYPEFEAILDHVVGIDEYKSRSASAIYVRINHRLQIISAVCFLIGFDEYGYADKSWNVPLRHLAESGGRGPDLGAGPIKLSCRNQCSVSWHQRSLWDPVSGDEGENVLTTVAEAIKRNRLGLIFEPEAEFSSHSQSSLHDDAIRPNTRVTRDSEKSADAISTEELHERIAEITAAQKLRVSTMKSEAQDHLERVQRHYQSEQKKLTKAFEAAKKLFSEEKHKNLQLKKNFEMQADSLKQARTHFQKQLHNSKAIGDGQLQELEDKFEQELQARQDIATTELKELLDMREVQLFYRDERINRMQEEIAVFKEERQSLVEGSGNKVLQRLVESGITFVAYQPGAEHLTIPLKDIGEYVDSPEVYVAEKLSIDQQTYKQWLNHYQVPACSYSRGEGSVCGKFIPRIDKPTRFISGESDRCAEHSRAATALSELMKVR